MATKAKSATQVAPSTPTTAAKPDYSMSNFKMLVLILLFIATSPVKNPVVALVQKMLDAILGEKLFLDAVSALSKEETPLVETTDAGTILTSAGKSLATKALQTSFKATGGGINADLVAKTSKTNYLLAVGGKFVTTATSRIIEDIKAEKFTPNDTFVYGREDGAGVIGLIENIIDFADYLGCLDEAIENVFPDNVLVNSKRNTITPAEETEAVEA